MRNIDEKGTKHTERVNELEKKIDNLIDTIKTSPQGYTDAKRVGQLGRLAIEYRDLTGRPYQVKRRNY